MFSAILVTDARTMPLSKIFFYAYKKKFWSASGGAESERNDRACATIPFMRDDACARRVPSVARGLARGGVRGHQERIATSAPPAPPACGSDRRDSLPPGMPAAISSQNEPTEIE